MSNSAVIVHSDACEAVQAARAAWQVQWPDACRTCGGTGGWEYSSPGSISEPPDQGFDPCPGCLDQYRCPRCATEVAAWYEASDWGTPTGPACPACPACGWRSDQDGPPDADCTVLGCTVRYPRIGIIPMHAWDDDDGPF